MKRPIPICFAIGLACFVCASFAMSEVNLHPVELRCEYSVNPLGIDVAQPRLSWKLQSKERGQRQTAYQIQVATTMESLQTDRADVWDSGKVSSADSSQLPYAGKKLASSEQVFWRLRVWDGSDHSSAWTETQTWTMGLLKSDDPPSSDSGAANWKAKWICAPAASEALLLRKEFFVKPGLRRAIAHVTGLGQYEMSLNGANVGEDLLTPGWTDYNNTILYDTRDVTSQLSEGTNAVGLELGNGMYNVVRRNRFAKFTGSFGPLRAIGQIELEYSDGSKEFVVTDESWRVNPGAVTYNSIYGGEDYDARLIPVGWNRPTFNDQNWQHAVVVVRPAGTLRGHSAAAESLRAIEVRQPVKLQMLSDFESVYDLGQNASYMPRLRVSGPTGSAVRLVPAELINADGSILRSTMGSTNRGISWWQYTKASDDTEEWFPKFYYVGCRYMQAELLPPRIPSPGPSATRSQSDAERDGVRGSLPKVESLEGVIVHSSAAPAGDFVCSNPLLNRIRNLVRWAQRANMVSVLTDCPHREKLGWLEQYHLNGPAIRYEFDMARMFTKGMNDMADAQLDSGLIPNIAPEYTQFNGAFRAAAEWGSAFIIVPWQQYQFYGDTDLLREHFPAMKRYFAYLENRATNDILSEGLGDWYDLGLKKPGVSQNTPPPITASAFYYRDAWILAQVAALLGKSADAEHFTNRAEQIRTRYNQEFFHADPDGYATGSQCANALPLVFGIVAPEQRDHVLAALLKDVESRDYMMTAGDVGFRFLLQALAQGGHSDAIYRMINQNEKPGYGFMLKQGETSLTESWDANKTSSHNHFMLGQITEWFYKDLAGIDCDPTGPGFSKIIIKPSPAGDLTWVRASYNSVRGMIESEWKREGEKFTLRIKTPPNTTATVFVPAKPGQKVREGEIAADQSHGVKFLREEKDRKVFAIESGDYVFSSRF